MQSVIVTAILLVASVSGNRITRQAVNSNECNSASASYDVVIIGAGIAGLSAAVELYTKRNIRNIVILEARNRIGGRIFTIRHNGTSDFEEYGAQWVHGDRGTVMMTYLSKNNLFLRKNEKPKGDDSWYNLNGDEIPDRIVESVEEVFDDITDDIYSTRGNTSLGQQYRDRFAKWLQKHPGNEDAKQSVFNFDYNDQCTDTSDDMVKVSTQEDSEYEDAKGDDESLIRGGYSAFLDSYTSNLPVSSLVQFGAIVKKINYAVSCGGSNKVAVYLADGRVILGKTTIVTLPLGVLKAGSVEFTPQLPSDKITAINRLGFGCAAKIFLFFRNRWWGKNNEINAVFMDSVPDGITVQANLYANGAETKWYRQLVGFNMAYGNSLILQGWITGDWARLIERLPLQEVTSVTNQILTKAFGKDYQVELPYQVIKSDWCGDPYTLGGYPYAAVGARASDFAKLAAPIRNSNLFFAGDGTSESQWACVHGALETGIRAAGQAARAL